MRLSSSLLNIFLTGILTTGASAQFSDGGKATTPASKPSEGSLAPLLDKLLLRELGPSNMSGRISDLAVYEPDPRIMYVASASGGVWKTVNGGTSFKPIFQQESAASIGAITVSQSNPDVVWVGTGEASSRNSVAWGNGVFKSTDGGKTFQSCGLEKTMHIGKIRIHPKNPNVVWVAATGRLWGRSEERGIYKTTDAGKTWRHVLYESDKAGGIDLDVDPSNPNTLYAALWDRIRKPYVFASGGITGGLFKSTDGGESWRPIMKGLPSFPVGRIGLDIYRRDPKILVALVEYFNPNAPRSGDDSEEEVEPGGRLAVSLRQAKPVPPPTPPTPDQKKEDGATRPPIAADPKGPQKPALPKKKVDPRLVTPAGSQMNGGGIFLSKDGGENWTFVKQLNPRPFYFSAPCFDPTDWRRIYLGGLNLLRTQDGGETWRTIGQATHADHHAIWVDPKDGMTVISGSDGGVNISRDRGATWDVIQSMPLGQFYAVDYDTQRPYWVYGGLQDNGSWAIPTQTARGGVGFWDAQSLSGGDGFFVRTDKSDPAVVYSESQGGQVVKVNRSTGQRTSVRAAMNRAKGLRKGELLRCNWNTPIELGLHAPKVVYVGSQYLLRSVDGGETFTVISPDLTSNSPRKQATGEIAKRISINGESTGAENHCTIVTIAESPLTKGVLATGSDDGRVNVTTDDGKSWTDVTENIPGLPSGIWCSRVILSRWSPNRIYATFDNHRYDDFLPYLYRSDDLGKSWTKMDGGLPEYDCLYVIREDTRRKDVLYLGSEMALRISDDAGQSWTRLRGGFPTVAVHDLQINDRDGDLIIGTHGRAIWTLDLEPLQHFKSPTGTELYPPQDVVRMPFVTGNPAMGSRYFVAPNTLGTLIYYRLDEEVKDDVKLRILKSDGDEIVSFAGTKDAGLNSVRWNGRANGVAVPVGDYVVEMTSGKTKLTAPLKVVAPITVN